VKPSFPSNRKAERGMMLAEVLVALLIMMFIMVGIVQLLSASLVSDRAAEARTELSYKAQQVVQVLRMAHAIARQQGTVPSTLAPSQTGFSVPIVSTQAYSELPKDDTESFWSFWGPTGAGVMELDARYTIGYEIEDGASLPGTDDDNMWVVTVTATPRDETGKPVYVGVNETKVVRYVAYIPKA
jgi:type II secretory pathway pseudopilin PulG